MMNNQNGRPLSRRQTVQLMIGLTILAWATQTLLKQWGYGAELETPAPVQVDQPAPEKFVPGNSRFETGATLELRSEAIVVGSDVHLRQVCRWSNRDKAILDPIGELVVLRLSAGAPFKSIGLEEVRGLLRDAGVNIAPINFAGATQCTVSRSDVEYDEQNAMRQWVAAKENLPAPPTTTAPATAASDDSPVKTLRDMLLTDISTRLNLPADTLQVDFKTQDASVLNTATPLFRFDIDSSRVKGLGKVSWTVGLTSGSGTRKVTISAEARAWQEQLVVARPLAYKQVIREDDLLPRRALIDQLDEAAPLKMEQAAGQQAARDIKPGTVLTSKLLDPVPLVKVGQFVTVSLEQGTVSIKTVVRAMESGSYGQTIRVKNEATRDVFQVVLTGPQTATMNLASSQ